MDSVGEQIPVYISQHRVMDTVNFEARIPVRKTIRRIKKGEILIHLTNIAVYVKAPYGKNMLHWRAFVYVKYLFLVFVLCA